MLIPTGDADWADRPRYALKRGETTIGRSPNADVTVPDRSVSRLHAVLRWEGERLLVANRSETNATLLNGVAVTAEATVRDGDELEVGLGVRLKVRMLAEADEGATVRVDAMRRRMMAVVHADVAGYTRLVLRDEDAAALRMSRAADIVRRAVEAESGAVVGTYGDGVLALHASVLAAVRGAVETQRAMRRFNADLPEDERLTFRIGINSGDVTLGPDDTYFGDAINTAARVQALARPGDVLVTGTVRDQLHAVGDLDLTLVHADEREVNARVMRLYAVVF
jgi:class 3 adenylate cyclase